LVELSGGETVEGVSEEAERVEGEEQERVVRCEEATCERTEDAAVPWRSG
jgi:hypothetical protein